MHYSTLIFIKNLEKCRKNVGLREPTRLLFNFHKFSGKGLFIICRIGKQCVYVKVVMYTNSS